MISALSRYRTPTRSLVQTLISVLGSTPGCSRDHSGTGQRSCQPSAGSQRSNRLTRAGAAIRRSIFAICESQRPARQIVLFDDVVTSGGQMVGSYRRLVQDASAPSVGFVVGRAVKEQKTPVLGWAAEDIPVQEALIDFDRFFGR